MSATVNIEGVPAALRALPRWLLWRLEDRDGKATKVPYTCRGARASSTDPSAWTRFDDVRAALERGNFSGIGLALGDGLVGVDLDKVRDPVSGATEPWALDVVERLGSYAEVSPSGTGFHVIARGALPPGGRVKKKLGARGESALEMYEGGRYFTVTGQVVVGAPRTVEPRDAELAAIHAEIFGVAPTPASLELAHHESEPLTLEDEELLRIAFRAANGSKVSALFNGNWEGYASQNEADMALVSMLAFYTKDAAQLDRIFGRSGLYRKKWHRRARADGATYGDVTIERVLASRTTHYDPNWRRLQGPEAFSVSSGASTSVGDIEPRNESGVPPATRPQLEAAAEGSKIRLTDLGNARRLVRSHGHDLRFAAAAGWFTWDGRRWRRDDTGEVERRAASIPSELLNEAARVMERASLASGEERAKLYKLSEDLASFARKSESEPSLRRIVVLARSQPPLPLRLDAFDRDPWLLNAANGTVNLKTGELRAHRREDLITKLAPVAYNPGGSSPLWTGFVRRVTNGDDELASFLQRVAGYCLTGDVTEQCLFFFFGRGSNGKSTFVEAIRAALGDYAQAAQFSSFLAQREGGAIRSDIARLRGARLVSAIESREAGRLDEGLVKQLTGGDAVVACFKFKDEFEFTPTFKIVLAANEKPTIRGTDHGIWRRIKLVPFLATFQEHEKDPRFKERLLATELPGILAWAVQGCLAWQRDGLAVPELVRKATEGYRSEQDHLGDFLEEACVRASEFRARSSLLYHAYGRWAEANGERPLKQKKFSEQLLDRGFEKTKNSSGQMEWRGLGLSPSFVEAERGNGGTEETPSVPEKAPYARAHEEGFRKTLRDPPSLRSSAQASMSERWTEDPEGVADEH